jgi:hypothetical protein
VKIFSLPHFKFQKELFNQKADEFKHLIGNYQINNDNLPASDFSLMIYQIWDLIKNNQDVDVPNQRTLLAKS